jgi:hypothetical protein
MAHGAVVRNTLAIFCIMTAVMTAEAPWIVVVSEVIGMSSPADLHVREDISAIYRGQCFCSLVDLRALSVPYSRILRTIELFESSSDLCGRFLLRAITGLDN